MINYLAMDQLLDQGLPRHKVADLMGVNEKDVLKRQQRRNNAKKANKTLRVSVPHESRTPFPDNKKHLLGTMLDKELAALIGTSVSTVGVKRRELGIKPFRKMVDWQANNHLFLEMTDLQVAKKVGCSLNAAQVQRLKIGISHLKDKIARVEELLNLNMPTKDIVEETGASARMVQRRRNKLFGSPQKLKEEVRQLLGSMTDKEISEKYGFNNRFISRLRKKLEIRSTQRGRTDYELLSSNKTNDEVGAILGITGSTVHYHRAKMGLTTGLRKNIHRDWTEIDKVLDVESDENVMYRFKLLPFDLLWRRNNPPTKTGESK